MYFYKKIFSIENIFFFFMLRLILDESISVKKYLLCELTHDQTKHREYHTYEPESHDYILLAPADRFEMVMKRRNTEYFFSISVSLREHLDDDWEHLKPEYSARNQEDYERISHHRHDRECRTEWEWSDIAHIEGCRLDIEPEKCYKWSTNDKTKCTENIETLIIAYECVYSVIKEEKSSRESIESIGDIHTISHGRDDQYEKWNIPYPKIEITEKWYTDIMISKFHIEPICSCCRKEKKKDKLHSCRHSLRPSYLSHIQIVIYESYSTDGEECEEREIGLLAWEKRVIHLYAK